MPARRTESDSRTAVTGTQMPTLDVVRHLTDVHVLTQLMAEEMLTRSQIGRAHV